MADEKVPDPSTYAVAWALSAFLFGEEGYEVVEERARNFSGHMTRIARPMSPTLAADFPQPIADHGNESR